MNLLELMVKVGIDDQATGKIEAIGDKVKSGLGAAAKVGAASVAAVGAAATGAGAALVGAANDVASYGDNIDKMSQKMGMSAEAYQEWDAVMQHSGTSMETMKASMKTLANAAETGNEAFQKLGLSQEQIASMSQEELFEATIAGLQNVTDDTERTYLAGQLLGRGATELGALLNTSAEDTQKMRDRVHELGGVMSDEAVKAAARYQDSLQDMQTALSGLKNNLVSEFLPGMATVMDGLGNIFSGDTEGGAAQVSEGVEQIIGKIREAIPRIVEIVSSLAPVLLNALVEVVSAIAQEIPNLVVQLVPVLIDLAPTLLEAGIQMFLGIVQALTETAPELIDKMVEMIFTLTEMLVEYAPQILEASLTLFAAILQALFEKIPEIVQGLVELLGQLVQYVIDHAPEMLAAAGQFIMSLIQAIVDGIGPAMDAMNQVVQGALEAALGFVGDMLSAGDELVQGLIDGVADGIYDIASTVEDGINDAVSTVEGFWSDMYNAGASILDGLVDGIRSGFDNAANAVQNGLDYIRSYLPFSPAKRGPFSGKGWTLYSGRSMMEGLAEGIRDKSEKLSGAVVEAMEQAQDAASGGLSLDAGVLGSSVEVAKSGAESFAAQIEALRNDVRDMRLVLSIDGRAFAEATVGEMDRAMGTIGRRAIAR